MRVVLRRWTTPVGYLSVLLAGTVVMSTVFLLQPRGIAGTGQLAVVLVWALVVTALWFACRTPVRVATGWLGGFLLAYLVIWLYQATVGGLRGETIPAVTLLVPFILLMIATKPPTGAQAAVVADVIGWTVVVVAVLSLFLETLGVVAPWDGLPRGTPNVGERGTYWLPLADPFGLNGRWVGPFVHPSLAGPWGAYLVVWGVTRRPRVAYPFLLAGFAILLLSASRTSLIGAIAGLSVWWAFHRRAVRVAAATFFAVALLIGPRLIPLGGAPPIVDGADASSGLAMDASSDLAMSGRAGIWPTMVDLWGSSPWAGVGDRGIREAIAAGQLPEWAIQAHNILLDAGVRTGIPGFLLAGTVFALAAVGAVRSSRRGRSAGLALLVAVFVTGLADLSIRWTELYTGTMLLLVAVLLSAPDDEPETARTSQGPFEEAVQRPRARERGTGRGRDRGPSDAGER